MALALPLALLLLQVALNVPQLVKLWRRAHGGVSLAGEAFSLLSGLGWLAFAAASGDGGLVISSVLAIAGYGPSSWLLVRAGESWRATALVAAGLVGVAAVAVAVGGTGGLGVVLTSLAVVQYGAYLRTAAACRDWSGFSPASSGMRILFGAGWGLQGALTDNVILVVWGAMTAVTFALTFGCYVRWRTRAPQLVPA